MESLAIKSRIRSLLRSPSTRLRKSRSGEQQSSKVTLERVLGITSTGNSGLTCDPSSGTVAYPAGCVVVLLNPVKNTQKHLINSSRKSISAVNFSSDGRYLVTGESGHLPAVRVWDVSEGMQLCELLEHKYGVSCVAFSPNSKYIVSVGSQHDMSVLVWAWKRNALVAANKVSSRVTAVSFSEDSSLFVTAGIRHVRFWYLEHTLTEKQSSAVPLMGRSGLLGELQNNLFTAVACGRGPRSDSTFCLTASGLLCEFSGRRVLERWVNLQSSSALSLAVSEDLIFCACADGTVRVFSPTDLRFLCTLPRPHHLGIDVSIATQSSVPDCRYPDCVALTFDPVSRWLTCVYSDHSLYVWDSSDLQAVSRVHSALYHSACVSDLQMCPSYGRDSFASCSSDNTIRFWSPDAAERSDRLSKDLHHVLYVDQSSAAQLHVEESESADGSSGIRTIAISPDGRHLASGDRHGTLRIHDLTCMKEVMKTEAHDSEILCLEYSRSQTGINLLASASRDRLIRVLDVDEDYRLMQTLDEHSSSVTSVHFTGTEGKLRMISCGADKSIYIRTAHRTVRGTEFKRTHHVVRQSTPSDMDVDPTYKYAAVGFQDRSVRLINISSGKQKRSFRGCQTEDGSLLKVHVDPSGLIMATSCSDKNISLLDFHSGEILDVIFGHSEIITALRFSSDCRRLVSASADSCIFVWRLDPQLTISMKERLKEIRHRHGRHKPFKRPSVAGLMLHRSSSVMSCSSESDRDDDEEDDGGVMETQRPQQLSQAEGETGASDQTRDASTLKAASAGVCAESAVSSRPPRRRWSCRVGSLELMVKSMLELRQLDSQSESAVKSRSSGDQLRKEERRSTSSLQDWTVKCSAPPPHSACVCPACAPDPEGVQLYSDQCVSGPPCCTQTQHLEAQSPVSAASMGYGSAGSSPDRRRPDVDDALGSCERTEDDHTRLICEPESLQLEDVLKTDTEDAGSPVVADSLHSQTSSNRPVVFAPQAGKCSAVVKPSLSSVRPLLEDRDVERPALRCVSQRSRRSISPVSRTPSAPHTSAPAHHSRRSLPASRLPKLSLEKLEVRSQCRLSSPSSPSSPQPWDSPNSTRSLRSRSYMSPTTSSRAKTSRCASIGEGLHHSSCESLEHPPKAAKPRLSQRWSSAFQSPRFSASQPDLSFKHGVSEEADPRPAGALSSSSSIIHTSPRAAVTVFTSDHQESLSVDVCRSAALDLCSSVTRAARLYRTLISYDADCSGEQQQMQQVMSDALLHARSELDSLPGSSVMRRMMMMMEDRKSTVALLEQYSQLLLRSLEERLQQHRFIASL